MASQHPSQKTEEEMVAVLDNIIKTVTNLQKDIVDIGKEIKVLYQTVQCQSSILNDAHDGVTYVEPVIENQDNKAIAQRNSSCSDSLSSPTEDEDHKGYKSNQFPVALLLKIQKVSERITEDITARAAPDNEATNATNKKEISTDQQSDSSWSFTLTYKKIVSFLPRLLSNTKHGEETSKDKHGYHEGSVTGKRHQELAIKMVHYNKNTYETVKEVNENIRDVQKESNILNGIEHSEGSLIEKLEMLTNSFESCLGQLQCHRMHLQEMFKAFKKTKRDLMEQIQTLMKTSKQDDLDIAEKKRKRASKSSSSDYFSWFRKTHEVESQLYCPNTSGMETSITEELSTMLTKQLSTHGITLKLQICKSTQDIGYDVPLILICLHSSRLGTDVNNAVKGIQTGPNVAVLILHHADVHALPTQSSRTILTDPEYKEIGAIVDIGFLSEKGIYDCDVNKKALKDLTSFLKQ